MTKDIEERGLGGSTPQLSHRGSPPSLEGVEELDRNLRNVMARLRMDGNRVHAEIVGSAIDSLSSLRKELEEARGELGLQTQKDTEPPRSLLSAQVDTSNEACAAACLLVSNPQGAMRRDGDGWQQRVNDLIRALRDERNALRAERNKLIDDLSYADLRASGGVIGAEHSEDCPVNSAVIPTWRDCKCTAKDAEANKERG